LRLLLNLQHLLVVVELCGGHPKVRLYVLPVVLFFLIGWVALAFGPHLLRIFLVTHALQEELILPHQLLEMIHLFGFVVVIILILVIDTLHSCLTEQMIAKFSLPFAALVRLHTQPLLVLLVGQQLLQLPGQFLFVFLADAALPRKVGNNRLDIQIVTVYGVVERLFFGEVDDVARLDRVWR